MTDFISDTNQQKNNQKKPLFWLLSIALIVLIGVSGGMLNQIHFLNEYQTSDNRRDQREEYERLYRGYQNLIVPQIVEVKIKLDFIPEKNKVSVKGDYLLKNTSNSAIESIFISSSYPFEKLSLQGGKVILSDDLWNVRVFKLNQALLPGETLSMNYALQIKSTPFAINESVRSNGSNIIQRDFEPTMGYVWRNEIQNAFTREKHGLAKKTSDEFRNSLHGGDPMMSSERQKFSAIISTSKDQIAVTSGELVKQWQQQGRNFYHYRSTAKIYTPLVTYFSATYASKKVKHKGIAGEIDIEMYYYPNHGRNIDEMISATKAALDYGEAHFGNYIFPSLRILEVPGRVGKASEGLIAMGQNLYIRDSNDGASINVVARRTIHEVAHQWWGVKLNPEATRGSGILIESMAMYMQSAVLGELYGNSMPRYLAKMNQRRYFSRRAFAREQERPLQASMFEQYLIYSKGSTVLFALRDLLGESKLHSALKNLMDQHQEGLTANVDLLLQALNTVSDQQQKNLIDDWFNKIIEYDLAIDNTEIIKLPDGRYRVTFELNASRLLADDKGNYSPINIDEPIQIALFEGYPYKQSQPAIYLKHHQVNQVNTTISLVVDRKPSYIMVDPELTRLDQNLANNIQKLVKL
jgi:ABC-2 type transport system permease protein